jgi:hypothetical protein
MPWCEPCAKYFSPSSLTESGECPQCGVDIDVPRISTAITSDSLDLKSLAGIENGKAPWHFKLLVGLLCVYLGWRIVAIFV